MQDKTYVVVDVESNGPVPVDYSMTQLGAVVVDEKLDKTFKVNIKPISEKVDGKRVNPNHSIGAIDAETAMRMFKEKLFELIKMKNSEDIYLKLIKMFN